MRNYFHDIEDYHVTKKRTHDGNKSQRECYEIGYKQKLSFPYHTVIGHFEKHPFNKECEDLPSTFDTLWQTALLPSGWVICTGELEKLEISELEQKFNDLAAKWKMETGLYSITKDKVNDTYLDIIGLGKEIIPFILADIRKASGTAHWHMALKALTGENPLSERDMGKNKLIKDKWIAWARVKNII